MATAQDPTTAKIRKRYDRVARVYDPMEGLVEGMLYGGWRQLVWSKVEGSQILEVGVDTGRNLPYHPRGARVTATDFSQQMLARENVWNRVGGEVADGRVQRHCWGCRAGAPDQR